MLTAIHKDSMIYYVGTVAAVIGVSVPGVIPGTLLIVIFAVELGWLPAAGRGEFLPAVLAGAIVSGDSGGLWSSLGYLVLSVLSLAFSILAWNARLIRSAMLDEMQKEYIRFARAKGLPRWRIYFCHAPKNALFPTLTVFGLQFGYLISGAFVIEKVFAWPGLGRLRSMRLPTAQPPLPMPVGRQSCVMTGR